MTDVMAGFNASMPHLSNSSLWNTENVFTNAEGNALLNDPAANISNSSIWGGSFNGTMPNGYMRIFCMYVCMYIDNVCMYT